jgi:hypothetical protein
MPKRINSILILSGFILFLSGCSASKIPVSYRNSPRGLKTEITGHWTEVNLNSKDISGPDKTLSGELIAIQTDTVYLLTYTGLKAIHTSIINNAVLYVYMNQSGIFGMATGLLTIPEIIGAIAYEEPGFLVLGAPWMITGTIVTIIEASDHSNLLNYPYNAQLQELKKFARFPQGMPSDIDKSRLHLITGK